MLLLWKDGSFYRRLCQENWRTENNNKIECEVAIAYEEAIATNGQVYMTC